MIRVAIVCSVIFIVLGFVFAFIGVKGKSFGKIQIGIGFAAAGFILTNYSSVSYVLAVVALATGLALLLKTSMLNVNSSKVPGIVLCIAGIVLGVLSQTVFFHTSSEKSIRNQNSYDLIEAEYLGRLVQEKYAGKKVGILLDYSLDGDGYIPPVFQTYVDAFQKGLGRDVDVVVNLPLLYRISTASGEEQEVVDDSKVRCFESVSNTLKSMGADVVLNLFGFPKEKNKQGAENAQLFEDLVSQSRVVLVNPCGSVDDDYLVRAQGAIEDGNFITVLLKKGRRKTKDAIPEDLDAAFNGYFVLVSKETLQELSASGDYAKIFPQESDRQEDSEEE